MPAQADLSATTYFLPLLAFIVVWLVAFAIFQKTKIIENKFLQSAISLIVAIVFVSAVGPTNYVLVVIPWFAIIIVGAFLALALSGFVGVDMKKPIGWTFMILLAIAFVVSALFVFSSYFSPYLSGGDASAANPSALIFANWIRSPRIAGALLLIAVSAIVAWLLTKK